VARLLVATRNPGKLEEMWRLLGGRGVELAAWPGEVEEVGETYAVNAALKADAAAGATGEPALGDDSGLEVGALDGFPGLHSARLAPTQAERNRLLFDRLAGVPRPWRARFVCVLALAVPGSPTMCFEGQRRGEVVEARSEGGGFGYDPVFLVPELGKTFAELEPEVKDGWSHRGAAARALLESGALARLP
jgi:XTP/dITP diphosphohydrolase